MVKKENTYAMHKLGIRCKLVGLFSAILGIVLLVAILRFNVTFKLNMDLFLLGPIFIFMGIFLYIIGRDIENIYKNE